MTWETTTCYLVEKSPVFYEDRSFRLSTRTGLQLSGSTTKVIEMSPFWAAETETLACIRVSDGVSLAVSGSTVLQAPDFRRPETRPQDRHWRAAVSGSWRVGRPVAGCRP